MTPLLILGIICALLVVTIAILLLSRKNVPETDSKDVHALRETITLINQSIGDLSHRIEQRMGESNRSVNESMQRQAHENVRMLSELTEKMVRLDETNKNVASFAEQLRSLQDILKNPKQRGILGEFYLETTLKNVLPPGGYTMQYRFPDGLIADAVVHVKDKIIPVDSKFSLENYNKIIESKTDNERAEYERAFKSDIKMRIDETSKYIRPNDDTMDFAFMFIPHEALYYDLLVAEIGTVKVNTQDLIEYAFKKKVLIVSPTSFLAFLQTVLQGLRALQIEESAKEIRKNVEELLKHLGAYEEYLRKVGASLSTTVNHFNTATKEFGKVDKDVMRITGSNFGSGSLDVVEKPSLE